MSWIKRNLYFAVGSVVAMISMGAAGWFLYTKWDLNNQILDKLNQDYEELRRLNEEKPHPGYGQIDNIKIAREQQQELRAFIKKARDHFERIPPIPDMPKPSDHDFYVALSRNIDQMQHDAASASVMLAPKYSFSFGAEKEKVSFPHGSLVPLSVQLGEVKEICDVLFQAKVNSLDSIRRERVCADDASAESQNDYLNEISVTNELAVLSPYEITFHSFSSELAQVLAGFANSRYPVLVKAINVEPGAATGETASPSQPTASPTPVGGTSVPSPRRFPGEEGMTVMPAPGRASPGVSPRSGGLPTVLDEKPLRITLDLVVVKLRPALK